MKEIRCVHTVTGEVKFFTEYLVNTSDFKKTKYIIQEAPKTTELSVDVQNLVHTASTTADPQPEVTADIPPTFAEAKPKKTPAKKSKSNKKING